MTKNVGGIDRTLRIAVGLALIAAAATDHHIPVRCLRT